MNLLKDRRIRLHDIVAGVLCLLLFVWFFLTVKDGINYMDESFYMATAQRFARGARPLVDDWHISQLAELLLVPFYVLYRALNCSADGILLFMRHMFLLLDLLFYWLFYRRLRVYGIWGAFAAFAVCSYVPFAVFAISYYTVPPRLLLLACCVLLFGRASVRRRYLSGGVLLSLAVLMEPPLALLYVVCCVAALIFRLKKKKAPAADAVLFVPGGWGYLTLSVGVCAAAFLVYLLCKSGFGNIAACLPEFFTDSEYDFSAGGNVWTLLLSKAPDAVRVFGWGNLALAAAAVVCAAVLGQKNRRPTGRRVMLCASACLTVSFFARPLIAGLAGRGGWNDPAYYLVTPIAYYAPGLINYLLCERRDRRMLLIWLTGLLSAVFMDAFSDTSFGICGVLCAVPAFVCFGQALGEQSAAAEGEREKNCRRGEKRGASAGRRAKASLGLAKAAMGAFLVLLCVNIGFEGTFLLYEDRATLTRLEEGPYRGVCTDEATASVYRETLEDLERIKQKSPGSVAVFSLLNTHEYAFLYLDLPIANCSAWYSPGSMDRQMRYFAAFPDKRPDALYFYEYDPFTPEPSDAQKQQIRTFADLLCEGDVVEGKQGILVFVKQWKDPLRPELLQWLADHGNDVFPGAGN